MFRENRHHAMSSTRDMMATNTRTPSAMPLKMSESRNMAASSKRGPPKGGKPAGPGESRRIGGHATNRLVRVVAQSHRSALRMTLGVSTARVSQTTALLGVGQTLRLVWPESDLDEQPIRQGSCLPWRALMSADDNVRDERIQHIDQQLGRLVVGGLELDDSFESKHSNPVRFSWVELKTFHGESNYAESSSRTVRCHTKDPRLARECAGWLPGWPTTPSLSASQPLQHI